MLSSWTPAEEQIIRQIEDSEYYNGKTCSRAEAIRRMRRRTINGVYKQPVETMSAPVRYHQEALFA